MVDVTVDQETVRTIKGATLKLNEEELWFLVDVLSCIGGDPKTTRRKHQRAIYRALEAEGVEWQDSPYRTEKYRVGDIKSDRAVLWFTQ